MQVFVSDKKRQAVFGGSEPFNRIKKHLMKEVKSLAQHFGHYTCKTDNSTIIGLSQFYCTACEKQLLIWHWKHHNVCTSS